MPTRTILAASGAIVVVGIAASSVDVARVSASIDVPAMHTTAPIIVAEIPWTLDLPAGDVVAGLTVSAPLAPLPLTSPPIDEPVPGLDVPTPIDFDHVAAYQRAWVQNKNTEGLDATASQRDDAWQKSRGIPCDDTTPQILRHLCQK